MLYNPYVMGVKALQTANLILLPLKYVFRRIKIAFHKYSPLTLRGLFVLLLCIYGYFISEKKNDFFLLILSIGGIGTFGILLIFNFMQFFLSIYLLKRNQDLISFQLAFHEGEINQEIPYTFVTKGLIVIPFFKLSITILFNHNSKLKSSVDMDKTDPIIVYLFSKKKIEINNNVIFRMRGYYNLDKIEISSLDRLRFTRISWKKVLEEDIIIYPQLKKRKEDDFYPSTTKEDMLDSTHRYLDGDYYEHRLYEVGDDVRRINWKLSAKRDELFIKIPEMIQPLFREILIFLSVYNPYPHYYNSNEMKLLLEDLVTGTASHVNILSNLGFKVFLGTDSSIDDLKNAYELKSIMMHLAKIQWEAENHFINKLNNFIKSLKNQYVDTTHLILYLPLLCEDWINGLFEVLDNHKMSCTLIMGRISKHLSTVGEDKTKHVSYNWLSKALFVKSLEENNGRLIKWDRFSTLYSEKRISISLSEKLIRNENQVMDVLKTIIDERIGYCPLQIRYIEKYYDKTLIQS